MTLEVLHDELYKILCLVDDICTREHVRYFLDSGTAIGAAREKDFSPWDDDLDLKVLREDYPAFKAAMEKCLPENYRFIEPTAFSPYFYDFVPRIVKLDAPLREDNEEDRAYNNLRNYLCVDIFIYDKAPESAFRRKMMLTEYKVLYGMAMSKRYSVKGEKYTAAQKIAVGVLRLLGKPFSVAWFCRVHERLARRWENKPAAYRIGMNYPLIFLHWLPEKSYEGTVYLPLRDRKFPMPSGFDTELTIKYGDYMHPPRDKSIYITHVQTDEGSDTAK